MKYIVEVHEPVPADLDEVAGKVASAFHISDDKARTLLRRAPGPVTRPVNEREARLVAEIFERAGLQAVTLPYQAEPSPDPAADLEPAPGPEPAPESAPESVPGEPQGVAAAPVHEADTLPVGDGAGGEAAVDGGFGARGSASSWESEAHREAGGEGDLDDAARGDTDRGFDAGGAPAVGGHGWDPVAGGAVSGEAVSGGGALVGGDGRGDALPGELPGEPEQAYGASGDAYRDGIAPEGDGPGHGAAVAGGSGYEGSGYGGSGYGGSGYGVPAETEAPRDAAEDGETGAEDGALDDVMAGDADGSDAPTGAAAEAAVAAPAGAGGAERSARTPGSLRRSHTPETARRSAVPEMGVRPLSGGGATLARGGLRRRVAMSATLPTLLTALVMLVAVVVTVLPVLRHQQAGAAAAVASSFAASIEGLDGGLPLTSPVVQAMLGDVARRAQASLAERGVRFMAITDASGIPLVSWSANGANALAPELSAAVNDAALRASEAAVTPTEGWSQSLSRSLGTVWALLGFGDEAPVVAAAPMRGGGVTMGAVVVGVRPLTGDGSLGGALLTTALVGLVPVLIAILVALSLTRSLTAAVSYLLGAADRISRGDLDHPVELPRNDELGQLARAIERMRVSLQEGLERLRRRR